MPPSSLPLLAVEIGGSKLQVFAGDSLGAIHERRRFTVDKTKGGEGIRAQIAEALPELIKRWKPAAVGVGYGGPIDWRSGRTAKSYHITGWNEFPLADWLREKSGLPVAVENDANTAALGEARFGGGRGANPVFYITLGSGVGGGLVTDGRLFHGAGLGEMEIGHVRLNPAGRIVEERCSGWALDRMIRRASEKEPHGRLAAAVRNTPVGGEAKHLGPALAAGDALAWQILRESMVHLAFALSHVVHLVHPEVIIVGGGLALLGEPLRRTLADALSSRVMDVFAPGPRIILSPLREDAVPSGALALAAELLEQGPAARS